MKIAATAVLVILTVCVGNYYAYQLLGAWNYVCISLLGGLTTTLYVIREKRLRSENLEAIQFYVRSQRNDYLNRLRKRGL